MTWYREWFGEEYLELYAYRDEAEARLHIDFFHERIGELDGPVLDLACGNGRHLAELERCGYSAVGFDLSPTQLAQALVNAPSAHLVRGDMRALPFGSGVFSGLVNFFTSFGYFDSETENRGVVEEMCRVLCSGAPFLFDYLNVDRELSRLEPRETRRNQRGTVAEIERWYDERDHTFNKRININGAIYLERVRAYRIDEIREIFSESGLTIEQVCGSFEGEEFSSTSPRLILIGKRR